MKAANGTYEVTPGSIAGVELALTNTANAVPIAASVAWTKVDPSGAKLAGSEWTLTGANETSRIVDNGVRDEDPKIGSLLVTGLEAGEYTLRETKAPDGYVRTDKTITATVDRTNQTATFGSIVNEKIPTAKPAGLATTGGEFSPAVLAIALALLAVGAAAVTAKRHRV